MAFIYRYDLTYHDIGISADSFVARLLTRGQQSILPDEMTEEQGKHLSSWLKGLFDSGNEGLSNDVFASCRPQDFYIIVPTLFHQTVLALASGILPFESVKGGLECKHSCRIFHFATTNISTRPDGDLPPAISDRRLSLDGIVCSYRNAQRH
jgi:hypothetical protein